MKANELMIGDWVECTYWTPSKQLKVSEIRRIMDDETKIGVYSDGLILIFRQSEVKPISLTPEILEKNGFLNDGVSFWYLDFRIVLPTSKGVSLVCGRQKRFEYVHELQHALRLCGINHEIIL